MTKPVKILLAQTNPTVGAIAANRDKILKLIAKYQASHDLIVFSELALTGYLPKDLLFHYGLYTKTHAALNAIRKIATTHVIIGHPLLENNRRYNAGSIFANGQLINCYHKQFLPNYNVFDEQRYFTPGKRTSCIFTINKIKFGFCICEDIWQPGPVEDLVEAGAQHIITINASPFHYDKLSIREEILRNHSTKNISLFYINQVGAQDDILFDGQSMVMDHHGKIVARAAAFTEEALSVTLENNTLAGTITPVLPRNQLIYTALKAGLKDYLAKNNFQKVILGLSGGIDSALVLCIAADALGADNVHAVMLPSPYTSAASLDDAMALIKNLGINNYSLIPITDSMQVASDAITPHLIGTNNSITMQNIQARLRCLYLMALANDTNALLLNTSNKSEIATGYSTLYGDAAGAFAPIKDVLKTEVYELARYRNNINPVIPENTITRAPSAELAPNQADTDNLPPYDILDGILKLWMYERASIERISAAGFSPADIALVLKRLKQNEYKRFQAPPGSKISPIAFGSEWRYPLTSGFDYLQEQGNINQGISENE